jgi:hypothetical protein
LKLSKQSYELPLNKEKAGVPKWLKEKLKNEGKTLKTRVYDIKPRRNPLDLQKNMQKPPTTSKKVEK